MTAALLLLVHASQVLAGCVVQRVLPRGTAPDSLLLRAAVVLLLGPAAVALQMVCYHVVALPLSLSAVLLPWWLAAPVLWLRRHPKGGGPRRLPWRAVAVALASVALATSVVASTPVYTGDALNNFALFGRLFATYRDLAPLAVLGLRESTHFEYPPLLALNEALVFLADDAHAAAWLWPLAAGAHLAFAALVVEALCGERSGRASLAAVVVVLLAPEVLDKMAQPIGDGRLTAGLLWLALELRRPRAPGNAWRVTAAAATCALTKSEGLAVGAAALLVAAAGAWRAVSLRRDVVALLVGVFLLAVWPLYRAHYGLRDVVLQGALHRLELANVVDRLPTIGAAWLERALWTLPSGVPRWGAFWPLVAASALAAGRSTWPLVLAWSAHLALYTAVFAITPHDLEWHLDTAASRLLLHTSVWGVLLLGAGLDALARAQVPVAAAVGAQVPD